MLNKSRFGNCAFRNMGLRSSHCFGVCAFYLLKQPAEQCRESALSNIKCAQWHFPRTSYPHFIHHQLGHSSQGLNRSSNMAAEILDERPIFRRTPNPPQSCEHCYQATNNQGTFGWSHQHRDLIAVANNSPSSFHDTMHQTALLPLGEMCLQVTVGSGLPVAMQVRLILFPSLMEISEEISTILGDTVETKASGRKINILWKHLCCLTIIAGRIARGLNYKGYGNKWREIRGIILNIKETACLEFIVYFLLSKPRVRKYWWEWISMQHYCPRLHPLPVCTLTQVPSDTHPQVILHTAFRVDGIQFRACHISA